MPKTGGVWVEKTLMACVKGAKVLNIPDPHQGINCPGKEKFTFAFVRHPLGWYRSYWAYKMTKGWDRKNYFDEDCRSNHFDEFINAMLKHHPGRFSHVCKGFIGTQQDPIDFVGRFENLRSDLRKALELAGEELKRDTIDTAKPWNVSGAQFKEAAVYTQTQKQIIAIHDREIFERFDYDMEGY